VEQTTPAGLPDLGLASYSTSWGHGASLFISQALSQTLQLGFHGLQADADDRWMVVGLD